MSNASPSPSDPGDRAYDAGVEDGEKLAADDFARQLADVLVRIGDGWLWRIGDGKGSHVLELIATAAVRAGLPVPTRPAIPRRSLVETLAARDGWTCRYCRWPLGWGHPSVRPPTVDHVVPKSRGGTGAPDNLALACSPCNRAKGTMLLEEWIRAGEGVK